MKRARGFLFLSAVCLAAALRLSGAADKSWERFRAFGGRTAAGEIKTLVADERYIYAFSAEAGLRYDRLLERWDFGYQVRPPDFKYDFTAKDGITGDIYFISGGRAVPYNPASDIYYGALQFPGRVQEIAFAPTKVWAKTNTGYYSCDRFNKTVQSEKDPAPGLDWFGQVNLKNLRNDPKLSFLSPFFAVGQFAELHPLSAVVIEPASFNVWVAYQGMGLWRYSLLSHQGQQITQGFLASTDVRVIEAVEDRLVMAGDGGLTIVDRDPPGWRQLDRLFNIDLADYRPNCLAFDRQHLFLGTDRGLIRLRQGEKYASVIGTYEGLPEQAVNCLHLTGDSLWVGTERGLALYLIGSRAVVNNWPQLKGVRIRAISSTADRIFLATDRGAMVLEPGDSLRPRQLEDPEVPELVREMRDVLGESETVWWLAPQALISYDLRTGIWRRIPAQGNYLAGENRCLAVDSANIWIGTEAGLARYFRRHDRWHVYHSDDGLMDDQVWALCSHQGYLWAGGPKGASRFCWAR